MLHVKEDERGEHGEASEHGHPVTFRKDVRLKVTCESQYWYTVTLSRLQAKNH